MKRRNFVKYMALASAGAPVLVNNLRAQSLDQLFFEGSKYGEGRILILIRLNGGNDGLNTVIPIDQYDNLQMQRSNILIAEQDVLPLTSSLGLHPKMTGMQNMYQNDRMGIIQNVGYPEQNRSHFRSMNIWSSGLIHSPSSTGWLGRNFDREYPSYPEGYPNKHNTDPFAISLGSEVSQTCQGLLGNFSQALRDASEIYQMHESGEIAENSYYGNHLRFIKTLIDQSNSYGSRLNQAVESGHSMSQLYNPSNELAMQLKQVAKLISGGLKTKVYVLNINGFDTHDLQVNENNTQLGKHADLLKTLSDGISAFQDDLSLLGLEDRVLGMTYSEFGRQIASNASFGTDHGDAAPLFIFGNCLNFNVMGSNPSINDTVEGQKGVAMEFDFRDIYASVLKDWFGVSESDIQSLFEHSVTFYPLLGACAMTSDIDELSMNLSKDDVVYPNPCYDQATIRFESLNERVSVKVYDMANRLVLNIFEGVLTHKEHDITFNIGNIESGEYIVVIGRESRISHVKLIKP